MRPFLARVLAPLSVASLISLSSAALAECGNASWYGGTQFHGRPTASGARFDQDAMTAAHRTLPFGTKLRVTYRGKSVVVRVNDRGPFIKGRSLDLSHAAAKRLGLIPAGIGRVCFTRIN